MERTILIKAAAAISLAAAIAQPQTGSGQEIDDLRKGFAEVPDSIRTAVYWYWISDNISEDGVVKDLHAMKQAGIAYATDQIIDLLANGVKNIHIYSMNKPDVAAAIMDNLSDVIKA